MDGVVTSQVDEDAESAVDAALRQFAAGPLAQLWVSVQRDVMPLGQAVAQAARLVDAVDERTVDIACAVAENSADVDAVALLWIVRSAVTALPGSSAGLGPIGALLDLRFVSAAAAALMREPDGRLARAALPVAQAAVQRERNGGDPDRLCAVLLGLGALCSNPIVTLSRAGIETTLYIRQRQFSERHHRELVDMETEHWIMPPPQDMLQLATAAYAEAAALCDGSTRGRTLKAQATCMRYLEALGQETDQTYLAALAREAATLIDRDTAMSDLLAVYGMLADLGDPPEPEELAWLVRDSGDALLARFGGAQAVEIAVNTMMLLRHTAPALAGAAVDRAGPLLGYLRREQELPVLWEVTLSRDLVARVVEGRARLLGVEAGEAAAHALRWAQEEAWDPAALASALAWAARQLGDLDREAESLELLDQAESVAPVWAREMATPLRGLRMELYLGLAVNAVNDQSLATAIEMYGEAMRRAIDLELTDRSLDCLTRISTLVDQVDDSGAVAAVIAVGPAALALENLAGEAATDRVQRIFRHAVARLGHGGERAGVNPEALLLALQVAKGMRFAALLVSARRFAWEGDRVASELLAEIGELEGRLGPEPDDPDRALDDSMLLAALHTESLPDDDDRYERLRSLRQAFDRRLHRELLGGASQWTPLGRRQVEASLDERTVLLELYLGCTADGNAALYALGMTRDDLTAMNVDLGFPDGQVLLSHGGRRATGSALTLVVADLRRALLEPSEPDDVSPEAAAQLQSLARMLPALSSWLDEWAASGHDHLCLVPHGALHYVPFQLLPHHGRPLAESWRVSTLPNRALLLDSRGEPTTATHRRRQLASFGVTYSDGLHGLQPLRHAGTEAAAVAAAHGTYALIDQQATETAVREALQTARFVHIAAHGRHDYDAPSFQCVYLTPDEHNDGVLHAHELLTSDLRGTEVVTLSACETALGQVDAADNPSGLPAALLLAGVRCVIGTLWDVRSDTAELFFTTLHGHLSRDVDPLDAFTHAQRTTRAAYPVYRDWGAFTLSGLGVPS